MARKLVYRLYEQVDDKLFHLGGDFYTPEEAQAGIPEWVDYDEENPRDIIIQMVSIVE